MVPEVIALFGIVMLPKPVVPLAPVTVKETVVIVLASFVVIVTPDISELVMFPLIPRLTVVPLEVVAGTVVVDGAGVGVGVGVVDGGEVGTGVA